MYHLIRLKTAGLIATLMIALLLLSLLLTPALAQNPGQGPPPPPAPKAGGPPLHYKSQQGLMPPAYVLDPEARPDLSAAAAPQITFLQPYSTRTVGSWPQVLAVADLTGDQLNDLAIGTDFYFDAANDRQLHLWPQAGGDIPTGTQQLTGGQNPFQIDPATGTRIPDAFGPGIAYRLIDGPGLLDDIDEITVDPLTGQMYGASTQNRRNSLLVKINKETGSATVVGSFGVKNVEGLAFLGDGLLYATTGKIGPATTKNRLYTVNPETGTVTEIGLFSQQQDYEGIACPAIPLGASSLQPAPQVESLIINEGQVSSSDSTLTLTVSMIDSTSVPEARWVLFQEYGYDPTSGQWLPVPSVSGQTGRWLDYDASASYPWTLHASAGVKYVQAWAADASGRLSRLPYQTPINYLPASAGVAQGQVHFYRYELQAGERLTARLTVTSGDADLYIWPVDYLDGWPAWVSNAASGVDEVSFVAPEAGVYQVEVHGYTAVTYSLTVEVTPAIEGATPTIIEHVNPSKSQPSQPTIPLESEPDLLEAAPPALPGQKIYLPALAR